MQNMEKMKDEIRGVRAELLLIRKEINLTSKAISKVSQNVTRIIFVFITEIRSGLRFGWLLFALVIMAFFDEQIFHLARRFFKSISQIHIMVLIALIALVIAIIQTVIAFRSMQRIRKQN